jgi:hypothetical protein
LRFGLNSESGAHADAFASPIGQCDWLAAETQKTVLQGDSFDV